MSRKTFDYEQARALISEVREITAGAHARVQELTAEMQRTAKGSARAQKLKEWINTAIAHWAERIEAIGALPKGVWTVDFDSGEGFYFCWTHDEEDLTHYHLYEEGFPGRKLLTDTHKAGAAPVVLN
jgi:hypothetical protein